MGRVISYGEKTGYNDGDYLLLDNGDGGTKRIRADRVGVQLDPTLTIPNKAAPANAVKPVDATLSQSGQAADAKVVGDALAGKVAKPLTSPNGTNGQLLRTLGNGQTEWTDFGLPTDTQTAEAISDWLEDHPEATTTVQDGAITEPKLANSLKNSLKESINSKSNPIILATWHDFLSSMDEYAGAGDKRTNRFYTSIDGLNFVEFNRDIYPLKIHSETTDNTIGAPSLVYWNGYFMLISSSGLTDATHDAAIGVSEDLVNWDWYDYTLGVRFDGVTPVIFAPELCVLNGDLYVVEAISIDNVGVADYTGTLVKNCRTYFAKVLSFDEVDGFTFDTAQLIDFYGDDTSNIDATIIYDAEKNLYYALVKNEYYRNVQSFSSPDLQTWSMLNDHVSWRFVEAPSVCYYGGTYHVYVDASRKRSGSQKWIYHLTTDDFITFTDATPISAHCKFTVQHGSVFTLSDKDAIYQLQKINDFAIGGIGKAPKKEMLVFYTADIRVDASSGNTRTMDYVSVCPNTAYQIALNRNGVITYLDNTANLDFVRITVAPNVTSGSLTIVNSGAGETYTPINEFVEINKNVREIILYKSSTDGILHLMPTREYKTGVITAGTNTTLVSYVCKKEGDNVQIQARITASDALSSSDILFNIPSGFRPLEAKYAIGCRTNDFTNVLVSIGTNGTVKPFGSTTLANGVTAIIECSYIV